MNNLKRVSMIIGLLLCPVLVFSATIHVPADQPTIQDGIDAAINGDTVLVVDGIYTGDGNWDIDLLGKSIVVVSENGPEFSIIDCNDDSYETRRGFRIHSEEDSATVIDGFTIRDGIADLSCGGGILCQNSFPTIKNCYFINNHSVGGGPALGKGGGLFCENSSPTLISCVFRKNGAGETQGLGGGGGMSCVYSSPTLINCTFVDNEIFALGVGSAVLCINSSPIFENCIIAFNRSIPVVCYQYTDTPPNDPTFTCCDIYGNEVGDWIDCIADQSDANGNFSTDPLFCFPDTGNYYIYDISPCAPDNNSCDSLIGAYGIGCIDETPVIISPDEVSVFEDSLLIYIAEFNDSDGPDTTITYEDLPSWITQGADSLYGIPTEGIDDTLFTLIVSDGYKADTQVVSIDVIPVNDPPQWEPLQCDYEVYEGQHLECIITASDVDGDILYITAFDLPPNANFTDSSNGHGLLVFDPDYTQAGQYNVTFMVSDGILSNTELVTITVLDANSTILAVTIDNESIAQHVLSHTPQIEWSYNDPLDVKAQTQFEIAVGLDDDWAYAEMWNPAPFMSADTFIVYAGIELQDGETYYLRLRVHNGTAWSDWYYTSFRMNSIPPVPLPIRPINNIIVNDSQAEYPTLWLDNSIDPEGDILNYYFEVYSDSMVDYAYAESGPITGQPDSTGWQVDVPLSENQQWFWTAWAFDQFETSNRTEFESFWVNAIEEYPTEFQAIYPPDTGGSHIYDMLPTFSWSSSSDPDPKDSVHYKLHISLDDNFNFSWEIDSIWTNEFTLIDSLDFGEQYWWKVEAIDNTELTTTTWNIPDFKTWMLGDANMDHAVNIIDITFLISYLYQLGPQPYNMKAGDINGDCAVNILDITYLIGYLYLLGPEPQIGCE